MHRDFLTRRNGFLDFLSDTATYSKIEQK